MVRTRLIGAVSTAALLLSAAVFAQPGQTGTAQEARALLEKAVAAVKADPAVALGMFNKGEGGFRDRDLHPFCFRLWPKPNTRVTSRKLARSTIAVKSSRVLPCGQIAVDGPRTDLQGLLNLCHGEATLMQ